MVSLSRVCFVSLFMLEQEILIKVVVGLTLTDVAECLFLLTRTLVMYLNLQPGIRFFSFHDVIFMSHLYICAKRIKYRSYYLYG